MTKSTRTSPGARPTRLAFLLALSSLLLLCLSLSASPAHAQNGLLGLYYAYSPSLPSPPDRTKVFTDANLVLLRVDQTVDFDFGTGSPDPSLPSDKFAIRWLGQVTAPVSEDFTFYTESDDGSRLWISPNPIDPANPGTPAVDNWKDQGPTEVASNPITLTAGLKYYIMVEYYENGGGAVVHVRWESASTPKDIIPATALTPAPSPVPTGTINGTVTVASGSASGLPVVITSGNRAYHLTTDAQGNFSLPLLLAGDYKITTYEAGVYAPVSQTVTIAGGATQTVTLALTQPVVLTPYPLQYTSDWVNSTDAPADYDVIPTDPAYDASSLPAGGSQFKVPNTNVTFTFPPTSPGAKNVIPLALSTFLFGKASYSGLDILASSTGSGAGYQGNALLTYTDGTTATVPVSIAAHTQAPTANEIQAISAQLLDNTGTPAGNAYIFYQFIPVDASKQLASVSFSTQLGSDTTASPELWALTTESSQTPEALATVSGTVTANGQPASGAVVRIGPLSQTTGANGNYSFVVPAGSYTIGALLPGKFAPALQDITVTAGQTLSQPFSLGQPVVQVQYPLNYSQDWFSNANSPQDYTFGDTAFPSEQAPINNGTATFGGITFNMGSTADGGQNMIFVNGQVLPVPEANYDAIYFLESCVSGSYTGTWTLNFTDGTTESVPVQFTDWCGSASGVEKDWFRFQGRYNAGGITTPNCAIYYEPRFIQNFTKRLRSITLNPDPGGYPTQSGGLFALTLEAASTPDTGTLKGVVKGPSGNLAGASIVVGYDPTTTAQGSGYVAAVTGADGSFSASVPPGTYPVTVVSRGSGLQGATQTVTVTTGQTTDLGTITLQAYGNQVISWLGAPDVNQGLRHLLPPAGDSATARFASTATTVAGEPGLQANAFAFDVDDNFMYRGQPTTNATIRVHYYDEGTDTISLVYNSSDLTIGNGNGKYEVSVPIVDKTDTKTWKDADVSITDAGFYGVQPLEADFRVEVPSTSTTPLTLGYVIVAQGSSVSSPGTRPTPVVLGDLNGDGQVSVADVTIALQIAVGLKTPTPAQLQAGDLNHEGKITIADVTRILRYAVGLIPSLP